MGYVRNLFACVTHDIIGRGCAGRIIEERNLYELSHVELLWDGEGGDVGMT